MILRILKWRAAYEEALRRDTAEPDPGPDTFDGKGSHVSILSHLEDVAKERGLMGDVEKLKQFLIRLRRKSA